MPRLIFGHTTENSIKIWVRGDRRWSVAFVDVLDTAGRKTSPTKPLQLDEQEFWTGVIKWTGLSPNRQYRVKVAFGKTLDTDKNDRIRRSYTEGDFTTAPAMGDDQAFTFLLGSCNLHSLGIIKDPDKAWSRVSDIARRRQASFMIHCGDQIYADIPLSPSVSAAHYRDKYLDAWDDCRPARAFMRQTPQYMILDDHEITNNFDLDEENSVYDLNALRDTAMKVYWEFQHKHNPDPYGEQGDRAYYYHFDHGSSAFFVVDTRFRRSSASGEIIDPLQMARLKAWLLENPAPVKFIVTSVPFIGQVRRPGNDKWCSDEFKEQRSEILDHLYDNAIDGVVFLTGDMHVSYYAKAQIGTGDKAITAHELMSSPLNQYTPNTDVEEKFKPRHEFKTTAGNRVISSIPANKFYGDHSNVMAIKVEGKKISYLIYRTRKTGGAEMRGSFTV